MLKNFFKIAWRNLQKEKSFSIINIFGLAIGLAVFLLIIVFVINEFGFDKYNEKASRIFRVMANIHMNGNGINGNYAPAPMGPALAKDFPQIEKAVRIRQIPDMHVRLGNEKLVESDAVFADSTLFEIFTLQMIDGNPNSALTEPYSIVISESIAKKYFNNIHVLDKTLITDDTTTYKITGVIKDMPAQSHFHFHFIKAMAEKKLVQQWVNPQTSLYLLARPGVTESDINKMLSVTVTKYVDPQLKKDLHSSLQDLAKNGDYFSYYSIPLTSIHLYSNVTAEFEPNGNIQHIYVFVVIAFFILLIACVNFMNLSTARSAGRAREVGVRKVLGSSRIYLIFQFLIESIVTTFVAILLSMIIALMVLPYFNQLSGTEIVIGQFFTKPMILTLILTGVVVGLFAGIYPAFYLSAFQPIQVLKSRVSTGFKRSLFRNGLIIFQFCIATCLIISTLIIYNQFQYIRNKELGYNRNQVLTISNTRSLGDHAKVFMDEVEKLPGVNGSTMTGSLPNRPSVGSRGFFKDATARASETFLLEDWKVDANYVPLLNMKMIDGRNFSPTLPTDSSGALINETAAQLLGYNHPINKPLYSGPNPVVAYHIIGVVKDFNNGSLRNKIDPIVFRLKEDNRAISFRINTKNIPLLIEQIKKLYKSIDNMADQPFTYSFMDDDFNRLYQSDEQTGKIFVSFAAFAIFIACLGLFGLVAYAAEQRTNEIAIRKVLGAAISDLVSLLSKDFLKLVLLASVISWPLAWWCMHTWLQDFAYRTNMGWWTFVSATLITILIALLTIGFQAIKAAISNPVRSLRTE